MSLVGKACEKGILDISVVNPRDYAAKRGVADDYPYGGGPGMAMLVEPVKLAIDDVSTSQKGKKQTINLSPQGSVFQQKDVSTLLSFDHIILVAGRYEGIDDRVNRYVDREYSVGDFVVSGGEIPAILMIDALVRHIPGVLGDPSSLDKESYSDDLLDFPHFTRPEVYDGVHVPSVLLSGDHHQITLWRQKQRLGRTQLRRPDLLQGSKLSSEDKKLLKDYFRESGDDIKC